MVHFIEMAQSYLASSQNICFTLSKCFGWVEQLGLFNLPHFSFLSPSHLEESWHDGNIVEWDFKRKLNQSRGSNRKQNIA